MMYDHLLEFDESAALTASGAVANAIDLGKAYGDVAEAPEPMYFYVAVTSGTSTTIDATNNVAFNLATSSAKTGNNLNTSGKTKGPTLNPTDMTTGAVHAVAIPLGYKMQRYAQVDYTETGTVAGFKVRCWIGTRSHASKVNYADAQN